MKKLLSFILFFSFIAYGEEKSNLLSLLSGREVKKLEKRIIDDYFKNMQRQEKLGKTVNYSIFKIFGEYAKKAKAYKKALIIDCTESGQEKQACICFAKKIQIAKQFNLIKEFEEAKEDNNLAKLDKIIHELQK